MKKRLITVSIVVLVVVGFYLIAFHGEMYCNRSTTEEKAVFKRTQYFFNVAISYSEWIEPAGPSSSVSGPFVVVYRKSWRGFGLLWKKTTLFG